MSKKEGLGKEENQSEKEPPSAPRESYGWLATSAVPAKKRRYIEGARRARARAACSSLRRPPHAARHAATTADVAGPAPSPAPPGVGDKGIVELQAQLYRTQQQAAKWKETLDPSDRHVRRRAGARAAGTRGLRVCVVEVNPRPRRCGHA
jgi:hypothetical protein